MSVFGWQSGRNPEEMQRHLHCGRQSLSAGIHVKDSNRRRDVSGKGSVTNGSVRLARGASVSFPSAIRQSPQGECKRRGGQRADSTGCSACMVIDVL